MNIPEIDLPRIVIVGGGFAGVMVAKKLKKLNFQIVLIDKNNYHTFQPLLYQVATSGLEPDSISHPIRKIFKNHDNFYFRIAKARKVIPEENILVTNLGEIHYDYLIMANGSRTNFFGSKDIQANSMPVKTVKEALDLRSLILQNFEDALMTTDLREQEQLLNVVIVGGGPTGVELAGALSELKTHVLPNDYPDLDIRKMHIHLIESGPRVLSAMAKKSSQRSGKFLRKMGVNLWLNTRVTSYDGELARVDSGKSIPTKTLIWAAGVKGAPMKGLDNYVLNSAGRFLVDEFNRVNGYSDIFAIGDIAAMVSDDYPNGHPMIASVAIQQGDLLARNVRNLHCEKPLKPFKYKDQGTMATIGRNSAVAELSKLKLQGMAAWIVWMVVHLIMLVGFRNKLIAIINWAWSYFNYDRGTRVIIRPFKRKPSTSHLELSASGTNGMAKRVSYAAKT